MPNWNGNGKAQVNVSHLLDATTMEHLIALVELGALVSIGTSRDGGALSIHVKAGDIKNREWFRSDDELHEWLSDGVEACRKGGSGGPSNVQGLRPV